MRVLFLTHRLPYAPNRGDRVRAYHLLHELRTFADVDLVSLVHDDDEAGHVKDLETLATTVSAVRVSRTRGVINSALALPTSTPLSHTMLDDPDLAPAIERVVRANRPDVVVCFCTGIGHAVMDPPLAGIPLVLDMVDVDSAKWAALASTSGWPRSWIYRREARDLAAFEIEITRRAFATILTTEAERRTLQTMVPEARIDVIQNGVDATSLRPAGPPADSESVVFCGVMNYPPNEEGAVWLVGDVWPRVRKARPSARLTVVGANPTARVRALASDASGVSVTGYVDDVRPYLWGAAVAVAPLLTARGVQNKVLEAVAAGLPVVVTPVVFAGVPDEIRPACAMADGALALAEALIDLLESTPDDRRALSARGNVELISWEHRLAGLQLLLTHALRSR